MPSAPHVQVSPPHFQIHSALYAIIESIIKQLSTYMTVTKKLTLVVCPVLCFRVDMGTPTEVIVSEYSTGYDHLP